MNVTLSEEHVPKSRRGEKGTVEYSAHSELAARVDVLLGLLSKLWGGPWGGADGHGTH